MFGQFTLITGPCVLESDELNLEIARAVKGLGESYGLPVIFKASFDKANRSQMNSARGPGLAEGLQRLATVKEETGLALLTDIHEPEQAERAAAVVDVLQIPAFLCRQTDLLLAAGATGKPINVKKGQWMSPHDMAGAVEKLRKAGAADVAITERGTFFGYGDLVVDMRSFSAARAATGAPVIFDGTHSVQRPGQAAGASGGNPEHTPALVRAAVAAGCDGLFLETHPNPAEAPSDGANMLPLERMRGLLRDVVAIRSALAGAVQAAGDAP
jgi:2-dehydro-3-deoxyphosphooctonate aldolase (KDO 8-P synthase)